MAVSPSPPIDHVLADLHASEINGGVSWFYDGLWRVVLGDRLNGYKAGATVQSLEAAARWLVNTALRLYPNSNFARKYQETPALAGDVVAPEIDPDAVAEEEAADLAVIDGVEPADRYIEILLQQGPGPDSDFIEAVDSRRRPLTNGRWRRRSDGTWALRLPLIVDAEAEETAADEDAPEHAPGFI